MFELIRRYGVETKHLDVSAPNTLVYKFLWYPLSAIFASKAGTRARALSQL